MPIDNPNRVGGTELLPMLHKWISNEEYLKQYHEICGELTDLEEQYKELTSQAESIITPYVKKGLTFYTEEQFDDAMKNMDLYMKYRFESYRKQISGETPSTWEGQKEHPDTLIEPEGLELYKMASATNIIGCPQSQVLNPLIKAYLGKDPDRSAGHFAKLILTYFRNPVSMFDKVPILIQYPSCRKDAVKIMHRKYGTASMFTVQGGPPAEAVPETAADAQQAINPDAE